MKVSEVGALPLDLPGRLAWNPGVILAPNLFAFQLLPGERGDYALLYSYGHVVALADNVREIKVNEDYSNITGSQIVGGVYFFGGGEVAQYNVWSPCVYPTELCAPWIAVYDGTLRVIKVPSGSCGNMNLTGVAFDGKYFYAVGGGNYPGYGHDGLIHLTGVVVLDEHYRIRGYGLVDLIDTAGNKLGMYRSGPKVYRDGWIYTLAYDVEKKGVLYLERFKFKRSPDLCQRTPSIKPELVSVVAEDFDGSAIPLLAEDLSVAYWDGRFVKWRGERIAETVAAPYIRMSSGKIYVAYNDGDEFRVESPVKFRHKGQGFVDWTGSAIVFEGFSKGSKIYYVDLKG